LEVTLAKAVTSKNSIISNIWITSSLRNFRNFCALQNFGKHFSLSLRVIGNYGNFPNSLFSRSEYTSIFNRFVTT
jgi:hypothetical protein